MSKPMHHLNLGNESFEIVDSTARNATDVLTRQVGNLVVENTTNASGWKVATVSGTAPYSNDTAEYTFTDLPEGAAIIEVAYSDDPAFRYTDNLTWNYANNDGTSIHVEILGSEYIALSTVYVWLTYAYPDSVDLSELTDIRVGADGTVYQTAGEAVRSQIQLAMAASQSSGSGLTNAIKEALMNIANYVAWKNNDPLANTYINALEAALYPSHSVTYNLTDVTSDNNETEVTDGDSFTAELTPASGLYITHIAVTMNGVDITNSAFTPNS